MTATTAPQAGWALLSATSAHVGPAFVIEQVLEILLASHGDEIGEVKADIADLKRAPYFEGKRSAEAAAEIEKALGTERFDQDRLDFHLKAALAHYLKAAAQTHAVHRCKALLAASACARRLKFNVEADLYSNQARTGLREANRSAHEAYSTRKNRLHRFIHKSIRVSKIEGSAVAGGLIVLTIISGGLDIPILAIGAAVGAAAAGSRLVADRDHLEKTLRETRDFGQATFGGDPWHGPEPSATFRLKVSVEHA